MLVTIETLRVRTGLDAADASNDSELTLYYSIALDILEVYCNRRFEYALDVEQFTHETGYSVSLRRFPLDGITSITNENGSTISMFHAHKETGIVEFDGGVIVG